MRQATDGHRRRRPLRVGLLLALALALAPGCGLKGPPQPPETAADPHPFP